MIIRVLIPIVRMLLSLLLGLQWCCVSGNATAEELAWARGLAPIESSQSEERFVLLAISSDAAGGEQDPWCKQSVTRSLQQVLKRRPALRSKLLPQWLCAGLPKSLTGGVQTTTPGRLIVVVADGQYRLLAFLVGVPDSEQLDALLRDSERTRASFERSADKQLADVQLDVASRSAERLPRRWNEGLNELLDQFVLAEQSEAILDDRLDVLSTDAKSWLLPILRASDRAYRSDVALRYGLNDVSDHARLVLLEQHVETRRAWVDTVAAFLVGLDIRRAWRPLTESVWGTPAVRDVALEERLRQWWETTWPKNAVPLELEQPFLTGTPQWPSPQLVASGSRRNYAWQKLGEALNTSSARLVTPEQLAALIEEKELRAIDILHPSPARYLFYPSNRRQPLVVREKVSPGRTLSKVRQVMR